MERGSNEATGSNGEIFVVCGPRFLASLEMTKSDALEMTKSDARKVTAAHRIRD